MPEKWISANIQAQIYEDELERLLKDIEDAKQEATRPVIAARIRQIFRIAMKGYRV
jgi:hypothetical protein